MAESCRGCKFWRPIAAGGVYACHFLLDTGIPRCYPPEECIYHTKGMENMSRGKALSPETIGQIEQMNAEGKTIPQISEVLGVSPATVSRVRSGKLKSPEAPTPMENASEDKTVDNIDNTIVPDNEKNVKQDDYSPYESAVDDAVLERIEKIRDRITEMQFDISNYETELNVLEEFHLKYMEAQNNGTR